MVVSRRSAKNLNWAGAVVLACLGLALLPVPVRAQQPTPGNVVPMQVQPAKKTPMSVDEEIETLRRALQQLEEQKRKEQGQGAPSKPANQASPWPANWKEENKVIDEINRQMREVEENRTLMNAAHIMLGRAHKELAWLKTKSPADPKETNKVIDEINRLTREVEENRTLYNAARIMLGRAHKELALLKAKSADSKVPSNVVPVSPR
jgi:hypothetical protein